MKIRIFKRGNKMKDTLDFKFMKQDVEKEIKKLDKQIKKLAEELNFEEAIKLRDKMNELKKLLIEL